MNKRHYEHTLPNIRGSLSNTYDQVTHPKLVRYGWQPFTRANLVNEAGMPASTFRAIKE